MLDCCFSEAAAADFDAMGTLEEAVAAAAGKDLEQSPSPERGTLLLCSSPRNRVSIGSATGERTLFTGALLEVLGEGSVSHNSAMLSFADLREAVWDRMLNEQGAGAPRPALHQPDQSEGDLTHVPAFPNAAIFRQEPREPGARKTKQEFAEAGLRAEADAGSKPPNTRDKSVATLQRLQATRVSHRFASIPRSAWLRTTALALILPILFYVYREVTRDVLIIDPFTVPKHFEEAGLTSEVMANRIGDRLRQIEIQTQTHMKKDNLTSLVEEGSVPDVQIPGTKLGLTTIVDITRAIFAVYPKHISGDIAVPMDTPTKIGAAPAQPQATVTVYLTQGRSRSAGVPFEVPADDLELLVQTTAEAVLGQVNPYVLAAYRYDRREYEKTIEVLERIVQDPSEDTLHKSAACCLWGNVLYDQKKYDEAITKYQEAIEFDPKLAFPYNNWGNALRAKGKYDEAIAKFQKAIELDPKYATAYSNWGLALKEQGKYDEANAQYQKAIELDPKFALAYNNWGVALYEQKKYDEAIAKYQKAVELDPKFATAYLGWGNALYEQKEYDEAIAQYLRAIERDPKLADAYNNWGVVLQAQGKNDEAEAKFQKARELSGSQ